MHKDIFIVRSRTHVFGEFDELPSAERCFTDNMNRGHMGMVIVKSSRPLPTHTCLNNTPGYDYAWWARDAQGIELCKVCDKCEEEKLSVYRQNDVDEPIYDKDT